MGRYVAPIQRSTSAQGWRDQATGKMERAILLLGLEKGIISLIALTLAATTRSTNLMTEQMNECTAPLLSHSIWVPILSCSRLAFVL